MVFGWGKKNRDQMQKTEETVERSVGISDVSQIVTDTLQIHSKTIVSETSSLHSRMDNLSVCAVSALERSIPYSTG